METNSKSGGRRDSVTASTALLNQKLGTSSKPRTLTPSEIGLLRRSEQEIAAEYKATRAQIPKIPQK